MHPEGLSDADLAVLRRAVNAAESPSEVPRVGADTLIATIDRKERETAERVREEIDELADRYGSFFASRSTDGLGWIIEKHEGDSANVHLERPRLTDALVAAHIAAAPGDGE